MRAIDLINDDIPCLKIEESGLIAISLLEEFKVNEMPLVDNGNYLGLVTEDELLDSQLLEGQLGQLTMGLNRPFVQLEDHIYEVISKISQEKLTVMPVLDEHDAYVGTISIDLLVQKIAEVESLLSPGGIIQLEMNIHDYSLTEISRLVESNDAKILNLYVTSHPDSKKMNVTLKLNQTNLDRVISTLNRFNYVVSASYQSGEYEEDLRSRYDGFMRYLNI